MAHMAPEEDRETCLMTLGGGGERKSSHFRFILMWIRMSLHNLHKMEFVSMGSEHSSTLISIYL
jgi:hypothetical protein